MVSSCVGCFHPWADYTLFVGKYVTPVNPARARKKFYPGGKGGRIHESYDAAEIVKIIRRWPPLGDEPLAMTVGNFDGFHLGHRLLIDKVLQAAGEGVRRPAVMTFEPHPLAVLHPQTDIYRIEPLRRKLAHLSSAGIARLYMPRFTSQLAAMPADEFAEVLFRRLRVKILFVGENFRFGHRRQGDIALLRKCAKRRRAAVESVPLLRQNGDPVSSGVIRDCLHRADFSRARRLLGRRWEICGRVKAGRHMGKKLGFPTANIATAAPICRGIFAARAFLPQGCFDAAVSIGCNPTFPPSSKIAPVSVEAHLINFSGDVYGEKIKLQLLQKLREEEKYDNVEMLRAAIAEDVRLSGEICRAAGDD